MERRSDQQILLEAKTGWNSGGCETMCGLGSTIRSTEQIRQWLPIMLYRYNILSINDAGAGDLNWISQIPWNIDYNAFDLYPRHPDVQEWDITKKVLPKADAILCRMVLNHLGQTRTNKAIQLFKESGAEYLITNRYKRDDREFHRVEIPGEPLEEVRDGPEDECYIGIWKL
jgi:hypothetical protein